MRVSLSPLREALGQARMSLDGLFTLVDPAALYERGIPERHRLIFYLGHVEAFDWNHICRWTLGMSSFHATFDGLFEAGIDPKVGTRSIDRPEDWPSVAEVGRYIQRVRHEVDRVWDDAPETVQHMAIEHRWMHMETTAYILRHLPASYKSAPRQPLTPLCAPPIHEMVDVPEGVATLGRHTHEGFGWDNEFAWHHVDVPAFSMSKYKVSNEQYLAFVRDGGAPPKLWTSRDGEWFVKTVFGEQPLPLDWPVYVSRAQAQSYAEWMGLALPTEAQFHRAAYGAVGDGEELYPRADAVFDTATGNIGAHRWDPVSVAAPANGESAFGIAQLVGNGWEWTSTVFHPFDGFVPLATYPGYSQRFFDDDHYVVKGGAPQTAVCLLRRSFRNWFRHDYPHADVGFRLVNNDSP